MDPKGEAKVYEMFWRVTTGNRHPMENRHSMEDVYTMEEAHSREEAQSLEKFTILVTHRLGAARMADEILVLNHGRIIEQGTHKALIQSENGLYKEMFDSQRCWYET